MTDRASSGALLSDAVSGLGNNDENTTIVGRYIYEVAGTGKPNGCNAYAALGDSYSSGEGSYNYNYAGFPCDRGTDAWPSLLSINYPAAPPLTGSTFFACSGDTTQDMASGTAAEPTPQLTALHNWAIQTATPGSSRSPVAAMTSASPTS